MPQQETWRRHAVACPRCGREVGYFQPSFEAAMLRDATPTLMELAAHGCPYGGDGLILERETMRVVADRNLIGPRRPPLSRLSRHR